MKIYDWKKDGFRTSKVDKALRMLNGNGKTYQENKSVIETLFEKATDKRDEAIEEIETVLKYFTLEEWLMMIAFFAIPLLIGFLIGQEYANHVWQSILAG